MTRSLITIGCFSILLWQGLVITNTLKTRLEDRTNLLNTQVQTILKDI